MTARAHYLLHVGNKRRNTISNTFSSVDGLTAMERTKTALSLSVFRKSTYILLVFTLPMISGKAAFVFYAEPIADLIASIVSTTVFLLFFQKHLDRRQALVANAKS